MGLEFYKPYLVEETRREEEQGERNKPKERDNEPARNKRIRKDISYVSDSSGIFHNITLIGGNAICLHSFIYRLVSVSWNLPFVDVSGPPATPKPVRFHAMY